MMRNNKHDRPPQQDKALTDGSSKAVLGLAGSFSLLSSSRLEIEESLDFLLPRQT